MSFGYSVLGFGGYTNRFTPSNFGGRGVFAGVGVIDYVAIATNGDATDFGDIPGTDTCHGCSNGSRGVSSGVSGTGSNLGTFYVTISTPGNATDFGDLTEVASGVGRANGIYSTSNHLDRGLWLGGYTGVSGPQFTSNIIDFVTISVTSNATDFGDINSRSRAGAATCSTTSGRAIHTLGEVSTNDSTGTTGNSISYFNTLALGNSSDFGDMGYTVEWPSAEADSTRAVIMGGVQGSGNNKGIEYLTIANTGNATDFGDTTGELTYRSGSCSNNVRALIGGGYNYGTSSGWAVIDVITIQTTGNAADFGDLTVGRQAGTGFSGD